MSRIQTSLELFILDACKYPLPTFLISLIKIHNKLFFRDGNQMWSTDGTGSGTIDTGTTWNNT